MRIPTLRVNCAFAVSVTVGPRACPGPATAPRRAAALLPSLPPSLPPSPSLPPFPSFLDDEISQSPLYRRRKFAFSAVGGASEEVGPWTFTGRAALGHEGATGWSPTNTVERVVVLGFASAPTSVVLPGTASQGDTALTFVYDAAAKALTIRKPNVAVAADFTLLISGGSASTTSSQ